jgi:hypothetical protein
VPGTTDSIPPHPPPLTYPCVATRPWQVAILSSGLIHHELEGADTGRVLATSGADDLELTYSRNQDQASSPTGDTSAGLRIVNNRQGGCACDAQGRPLRLRCVAGRPTPAGTWVGAQRTLRCVTNGRTLYDPGTCPAGCSLPAPVSDHAEPEHCDHDGVPSLSGTTRRSSQAMGTPRRRCGGMGPRTGRAIHGASIGGDDRSCR